MIDLTVAIPTYNGEHRLPDVLNQLRLQSGTESFSWEVLVIDNNSGDRTAAVIQQYQANSPFPLRYCVERRQGAAYARARAVREARGHLIGFLDDDNIPAHNWVAAACIFAHSHPQAGAFASRIYGEYEVPPPPDFDRIAPFLAITQRGGKPLLYEPKRRILPPSAGLVIRKQVWIDHVPKSPILVGRLDDNPLAGEDLEMVSYIQQSPWEIWYNPAMEMVHKIPRERLERGYLVALFRGMGLSRHVTRMLSVRPGKRPMMFVAYLLNDLRKIVTHLWKYGINVRGDVVTACELEFFLSSLISPFYLWQKGYLREKNENFSLPREVNSIQSQSL